MVFYKKPIKRYRKRYVPRKYVGKSIQPVNKMEFKKAYVSVASACDTTGAITLLNGLTRGDDEGDRDGRRTCIKSIQFKGVSSVTTNSGIDQMHRILLVRMLRPNGTAPTINDVLQATQVYALRNRAKIGDFQVLYDKTIALNAAAESGSKRFLKYYKRMTMEVQYNAGNAGTIADIEKNALYLITIGSVGAGATAGTFDVNFQIDWLE